MGEKLRVYVGSGFILRWIGLFQIYQRKEFRICCRNADYHLVMVVMAMLHTTVMVMMKKKKGGASVIR